MYLLNDIPLFLEFFKRFCKFANYEFKNKKIYNKLFFHSKCNCGDKDCATIYLKLRKPFKKEIERFSIKIKKTDDIIPRKQKNIKQLSNKSKNILHTYFKDLIFKKPNIINLGELNL